MKIPLNCHWNSFLTSFQHLFSFFKELNLYDIHSFDPNLGRTLLEFQALVDKRRCIESVCGEKTALEGGLCFRNMSIEDLCLDFSLPGYPDCILSSDANHRMVWLWSRVDFSFPYVG